MSGVSDQVSVVIATHNRAGDVANNLSALFSQTAGSDFEVIVVDSASRPADADALRQLAATYPITLIRLDVPGASRARNAGIAAARHAWIAFLDDDAAPRPDWYERVKVRLSEIDHRFGVIAGRVMPRWPASTACVIQPVQLGSRSRMLLSAVEETSSFDSTPVATGVGANILFRKDALIEIGCFPEHLGPLAEGLGRGEDSHVIDEVLGRGHRIWYDGTIAVDHTVHADRMNRGWLSRRAREEGIVDWNRTRNPMRRWVKVSKSLVALPVLHILSAFDSPAEEYFIRYYHNLGFVQKAFGLC